jgi:hypothetical protein
MTKADRLPDIVNTFFRMHYPDDAREAWEMRSLGCGSYGREYTGDRTANSIIFPEMVCADGFRMSVQGHYGAYSQPHPEELRPLSTPAPETLEREKDKLAT